MSWDRKTFLIHEMGEYTKEEREDPLKFTAYTMKKAEVKQITDDYREREKITVEPFVKPPAPEPKIEG